MILSPKLCIPLLWQSKLKKLNSESLKHLGFFFWKNVKYLQNNFKQNAAPNFMFPCSRFPNNQSRRKSVSKFIGAEIPYEWKSRRWHELLHFSRSHCWLQPWCRAWSLQEWEARILMNNQIAHLGFPPRCVCLAFTEVVLVSLPPFFARGKRTAAFPGLLTWWLRDVRKEVQVQCK